MKKNKISFVAIIIWVFVILIGVGASAFIALNRNEPINSVWLIVAAICIYLTAYRFYANFVAAKVLLLDEKRVTPAIKFKNGRDYEPTNKWVLFGHHFAAIAGPGPLIGPTLAAQFGYLPGVLWILIGSVVGGCVQDMVILLFSIRRNGRSLCQMAKDELGRVGSIAAMIGILVIMVILIAVLGLVVVNAMKHSPWATFTVFSTIPIALLMGIYTRYIRVNGILEASIVGFILLILAVVGGKFVAQSSFFAPLFDHTDLFLAWCIIIYGFLAAVLPVWLLLTPRDYLSSFLKLGTIIALAIAILILNPEIKMPAITKFVDGEGPIFAGKIFPFLFITIACGAISGFHSLIASGTTPKLISNEKHVPAIGYGAMILESFVALMALIAATIMEPGIYFAINSPVGAVGHDALKAVETINSWGFSLTLQQMEDLAAKVGETSLFNRTGGAPSLAVGMASIFASAFGDKMLNIWYHFIIMFEAVFILTTLDAGTRVCRFMLQDSLGHIYKPLGDNSSVGSTLFVSFLVVLFWGYFLYNGVIDPNGGVNMLWPLFGMANQILAAIALCVATCIIIKSKKTVKYCFVTLIPLVWLVITTLNVAWEKLTSDNIRIGAIAFAKNMKFQLDNNLFDEKKLKIAPQLIFNQYVVAFLTAFLAIILIVVIIDMIITIKRCDRNKSEPIIKDEPEKSFSIDHCC